jgi:hypothetical protein
VARKRQVCSLFVRLPETMSEIIDIAFARL